MSPVAIYFFLAVHLTNLHTILYGCEVTKMEIERSGFVELFATLVWGEGGRHVTIIGQNKVASFVCGGVGVLT